MCVAAEFDLFDAVMSAHFGRLLMMEAAAANGASDATLDADHLVAHELVRALVGVSQLLVDVATVCALALRLCLCSCHVVTIMCTADIPVRLRHGR